MFGANSTPEPDLRDQGTTTKVISAITNLTCLFWHKLPGPQFNQMQGKTELASRRLRFVCKWVHNARQFASSAVEMDHSPQKSLIIMKLFRL